MPYPIADPGLADEVLAIIRGARHNEGLTVLDVCNLTTSDALFAVHRQRVYRRVMRLTRIGLVVVVDAEMHGERQFVATGYSDGGALWLCPDGEARVGCSCGEPGRPCVNSWQHDTELQLVPRSVHA